MDDWVEQIERVEKNDPECTEIYIGYRSEFSSDILKPFVKAISKNTHLTSIEVCFRVDYSILFPLGKLISHFVTKFQKSEKKTKKIKKIFNHFSRNTSSRF